MRLSKYFGPYVGPSETVMVFQRPGTTTTVVAASSIIEKDQIADELRRISNVSRCLKKRILESTGDGMTPL